MNAKTSRKSRKSQAGCNPMIHNLNARGLKPAEAYTKVAKRFGFGKPLHGVPAWFKKIWSNN